MLHNIDMTIKLTSKADSYEYSYYDKQEDYFHCAGKYLDVAIRL